MSGPRAAQNLQMPHPRDWQVALGEGGGWAQLELTYALGLVDILEFVIGWDRSFVLFIVSSSKSAWNPLRSSEEGKSSYSVHSQEACSSL